MTVRVEVLGGGRMGEALVGGLVSSGWARPEELCVVEKLEVRRAELSARHPGLVVVPEPVPAAGAVVAVKPQDVEEVCRAAAAAGLERAVSIAAGVPLARLEAVLGPIPVVRAMPNTPALVGAGAAAIAPGSRAGEADMAWAEEVLGAVGVVVRVAEPLLDAVTGLSGSGPAYVFLVAEALVDAGVMLGLPRDVSATLSAHTLLGASRLLVEAEEGPEALRAAVTSPGGTTAAGLRALEARAVRSAVLEAVAAAAARSRELGGA